MAMDGDVDIFLTLCCPAMPVYLRGWQFSLVLSFLVVLSSANYERMLISYYVFCHYIYLNVENGDNFV